MTTGAHAASAGSDLILTIKRNCSCSPRTALWLLAAPGALVLGIAGVFAALGAWLIVPFAGIELVALAAAFYLNGRHATDHERIALSRERIRVDVQVGERVERHEFRPGAVRLAERVRGPDYRLVLHSAGRELEIGRHWDAERRRELARRLGGRVARA